MPVNADVPELSILMLDEQDPHVTDIGAKGIDRKRYHRHACRDCQRCLSHDGQAPARSAHHAGPTPVKIALSIVAETQASLRPTTLESLRGPRAATHSALAFGLHGDSP